MTIIIDGTNGITSVNGSASAPSVTGTDTNTGISYGTDLVYLNTGGSTRVTVDASGNVGVGVTPSSTWNSDQAFEIGTSSYRGSLSAGTTSGAINLSFNAYSVGSSPKYINTAAANLFQMGSGAFYWYTAASGTAGNTITWTTAMTLAANRQAAFTADIADYHMTLVNSQASGYGIYVQTNNSSGSLTFFDGYSASAAAYKVRIYTTGTISNATGTYNTISDQKLKENIVDATPKLDKVLQLRVRNYNLIGDELKQIGFVAQEIEQIFPNLVTETVYPNETEPTKEVKTSVLIPILVKAIQELTARVQALEGAK